MNPVRTFALLVCVLATPALAQEPDTPSGWDTALTGELRERGTRDPLPDFLVVIAPIDAAGDPVTAVTDVDGRFLIQGLAPGTWSVTIDEVGYLAFTSEELVVAGQSTDVRYYVERARYDAYVSATVTDTARREVTRRDIGMEEIQNAPGTANDALRVVVNLPGVARAPFDFAEVIMRGSESADNQYVLDGLPLPILYHFGGLRAVVPTEMLGELQVYPGGFGASYGDATGGVIDARTREPRDDRVGGHADVNLYDAGLFLEGPISDRLTFQLGGRRSYADAVISAVDLGDTDILRAPRYYDGQARLRWQAASRVAFSATLLASDDRLAVVDGNPEERPPSERGTASVGLWFHGLRLHLESASRDGRLHHTSGLQLLRGGQDLGDANEHIFLEREMVEVRHETRWEASDRVSLLAGIEANYETWSWDVRSQPVPVEGDPTAVMVDAELREDDTTLVFSDPALFAALTLRPALPWSIAPGARVEHFVIHDETVFDPRLSTRVDVLDSWALTASAGLYHRALESWELSEVFGNPDQRTEAATHYTLGTEHVLSDPVSLSVEGFYKDLQRLSSPSDRTVERDGEVVAENLTTGGRGRVYGVEVFLRHHPLNRLFGWVSYTLSRSERRDFGSNRWRVFDTDQTHILTLLASYRLRRGWSIGGRFRYVTGNPTTSIVGSTLDADRGEFVPIPGPTNEARLPAFYQLDLRVDKRWIRDAWTLTLYLDVQNVTLHTNVEEYAYDLPSLEPEPIGGLPFFPVFGLRGEF